MGNYHYRAKAVKPNCPSPPIAIGLWSQLRNCCSFFMNLLISIKEGMSGLLVTLKLKYRKLYIYHLLISYLQFGNECHGFKSVFKISIISSLNTLFLSHSKWIEFLSSIISGFECVISVLW